MPEDLKLELELAKQMSYAELRREMILLGFIKEKDYPK